MSNGQPKFAELHTYICTFLCMVMNVNSIKKIKANQMYVSCLHSKQLPLVSLNESTNQ